MDIGLFILAYGLIFLGLVGSLVPLLPGPVLIWLGTLLWAIADQFRAVGWPTLVVLALLGTLAWSSDWVVIVFGVRRTGASWKTVLGAIVFGILGGVLFSGVPPLIGSIVGTVIGAVFGILLVEYLQKRNWELAFRAGKGYILGYLAANLLEFLLALLMIAIFAWQAFL